MTLPRAERPSPSSCVAGARPRLSGQPLLNLPAPQTQVPWELPSGPPSARPVLHHAACVLACEPQQVTVTALIPSPWPGPSPEAPGTHPRSPHVPSWSDQDNTSMGPPRMSMLPLLPAPGLQLQVSPTSPAETPSFSFKAVSPVPPTAPGTQEMLNQYAPSHCPEPLCLPGKPHSASGPQPLALNPTPTPISN